MTTTTKRRVSTGAAAQLISERMSFTTSGALRGQTRTPGDPVWGESTGRLPREWFDSLTHADYVVTSYATPIAWHVPDEGWVRPAVKYSPTTSRHQGVCPA